MQKFNETDYSTYAMEHKEELLRSAISAIDPDYMRMTREQALTLAGAMKNCGFDREDFAAVMSKSTVDKGTFARQWDGFRGSGQKGDCTEGTIFDYAKQCGWKWPAPDKAPTATASRQATEKKSAPALVLKTENNFTLRCIMDSVPYTQKPQAVGEIRSREQIPTPPPQEMTLQDFAEAVTNGRTFYPAVYSKEVAEVKDGKKKYKYRAIEQQLFVVDIDNEEQSVDADGSRQIRGIKKPLTIAKAREICEKNGIEPFLIYETFSSKAHRDDPKEPYQKFRLCFALDKPLQVQEVGEAGINRAVNYFINFFGEAADHKTTDTARLIYGTDEKQSAQFAPKAISKDKLYKKLFTEAEKPEETKEAEQEKQIIDIKPVGEYIDLFRSNREAYKNNLRTGFLSLDMVLGGGFGNELYVLASETGSGKSAIASVLAQNIAKSGVDVYYFALEMGRDEFIARGASMISAEIDRQSAIPFGEILGDTFDPQMNDFYRRAYSQYEDHVNEYSRRYGEHLFVIECSTVGTTAGAIIDTVKKLRKDKKGRFMVFIDYLQLITADPADRTQRDKMTVVSAATMAFKAFASQYGAAVFLLSSMANDKTGRDISETSFKYSGDIAFTGGVLLAWTWEGVTNTSDEERRSNVIEESKRLGYREMTINVLKHRNGAKQGKARLIYYPAFNYIVEADTQAQTQGKARTNGSITSLAKARGKKRDIQREELQEAFEGCKRENDGFTVTLGAMADYMDKSKSQVKRLIKEYGGYSIEQDGAIIFSGEIQEQEIKANLPEGIFADSNEDPRKS